MARNEVTRQDYREAVSVHAEGVINSVEEWGQELSEAVWEEIDGSSWIIYNHKAAKVANEFSDSTPDEWKHLVDEDASFQEITQAYAYKCMEQDLYEELESQGFLDNHWNPVDEVDA